MSTIRSEIRHLLDDPKNSESMRMRMMRVLGQEWPGVKFTIGDISWDDEAGTARFVVTTASAARVAKRDELERKLNINLHRLSKEGYGFAYYDEGNPKPFVLRHHNKDETVRASEKWVVEHFSKGLPR